MKKYTAQNIKKHFDTFQFGTDFIHLKNESPAGWSQCTDVDSEKVLVWLQKPLGLIFRYENKCDLKG